MKVSELIEKLMDAMDEIGDKEVVLLTSVDDGEGEDRNVEFDIESVDTMFSHYIFLTADDNLEYYVQRGYDD